MKKKLALGAVMALFVPTWAAACPYCAQSAGPERNAYLIATALMLGVPLAMLGALAWWWRRMGRRANEPAGTVGGAVSGCRVEPGRDALVLTSSHPRPRGNS